MGAEFCADRQTQMDMTKLIVAFRNFANAPKNVRASVTKNGDRRCYVTLNVVAKSSRTLLVTSLRSIVSKVRAAWLVRGGGRG